MKKLFLVPFLAIVFFAACGGAQKKADGPLDKDVQAGDGWRRVEAGVWAFSIDGEARPNQNLSAFGTGQGLERIDLPKGAKKATVRELHVTYTSEGSGDWILLNDENGLPGKTVLGRVKFQIPASSVTAKNQPAKWVKHAIAAEVNGTFWAVFMAPQEPGAQAANVGAVAGIDSKRLKYREAATKPANDVHHLPLVRVMLEGVQ